MLVHQAEKRLSFEMAKNGQFVNSISIKLVKFSANCQLLLIFVPFMSGFLPNIIVRTAKTGFCIILSVLSELLGVSATDFVTIWVQKEEPI